VQSKDNLALYRLAKDGADKNPCKTFSELSQNSEFILREAAQVRALITCPQDLLPIYAEDSKSPWLAPIRLELAQVRAQNAQDPQARIQAYADIAKSSSRSKDKIKWWTQAITVATAEHLPEEQVADLEEKLSRVAPRLAKNPPANQWLKVGNDWLFQRDFKKARFYFDKVIANKKASVDDKYLAYRFRRNSFKLQQDKASFLRASQDLLKWAVKSGNESRISESYLSLARAFWTQGKLPEAQKLLNQGIAKLKKSSPREDFYFVLGKMEDEQGRHEKAVSFYEKGLASARKGSLTLEKLGFAKAWALRKMGKTQEAAGQFAQLAANAQPKDASRFIFWQAMTLKDQTLFQKVVNDDPLGYYGQLAVYELNTGFPALLTDSSSASKGSLEPDAANAVSLEIQKMIRALNVAGEKECLESFVLSRVPLDQQSNLFVLKNLAESGLYQPLFASLISLSADDKRRIVQTDPELIFPRKFLPMIQTASQKVGLEPEIALSIIRQESSFDPMARSEADAFGLMQVLPSVAKRFKTSLATHEDLYKPDVNIPLGTQLLAELQNRYQGSLILTAAAYNASEEAIAGWLRTRFKGDVLEFIEDIPYEETRIYVKLVLRNYLFYKRLNQPTQAMPFPEQSLKVLGGAQPNRL
jgi:soluble lytic murein transglycosylase